MSAERSYRIHGLQVRSDLELDGAPSEGGTDDVFVRVGPNRSVGIEQAEGAVVAEFVTAARRWWTATENEAEYLLRFHGTCDIALDATLKTLTCWPNTDASSDVVPLLISGTALSFLLGLQNSLVLHASAVQIGEGSVAFAGLPGMGKSTVAGLLCSAGSRLVSDDALRVDLDNGVRCFRGTSKIRLRPAADSVLSLFPHVVPSTSPDHRLTFEPTPSDPDCLLSAVVIPHPSRQATRVETHRIDPAEAVFRLSPFLRIAKWCRPDLISQHFRLLAHLAARVPTFALTVPWITPFTAHFASELFASIEELIENELRGDLPILTA